MKYTNIKKILLGAAAFTFVSCAQFFQGKIDMDNSTTTGGLSTLFTYTSDTIVLDAPKQIFISDNIYSSTVKISWKEVKNATSYVIERSVVTPDDQGDYAVPDEETFETLNSYVYGTSYEDEIDTTASSCYTSRYYYRVRAENIGKGYESSEYTKIEDYGTLFAPPSAVQADKGKSTSEINITWSSVTDARSYKIWRGKNTSELSLVATVSGSQNTYADDIAESDQGTEFYYAIVAENSYSQESAKSSIAMGYALKSGSPAAPDNVKVVDGLGTSIKSLNISWDAVSADSSKVVKYNLYRSSSEDSTVNLVKSRTDKTSYIDATGLKPGVYYYYYVVTVESSASDPENEDTFLKSGFSLSGPDSENPAYGFLLSPPTVIKVEEIDGDSENIILKWKPALGYEITGDTNAYYYNVYQSAQLQTAFSLLKQNVETVFDSDGYISVTLPKCNYYKIATVNSENLESTLSSAAAPAPSAPLNVTASKNKLLASDFKPNAHEVYPVEITWDPPANETPTAYTVYRSASPDKDFKKVATVTECSCIDKNTSGVAGVFYYYKVIALNIQYEGHNSNNPAEDTEFKCRGYGAITRDQWFREYNKTIMHSQSKLTLMHKSNDMDKLGTETIQGDIGGSLTYTSSVAGLGAEIKMPYTNYTDFYCGENGKLYIGSVNGYSKSDAYSLLSDEDKKKCVVYFCVTGSTDTSCNMSANGNMSNSVTCTGMYPGKAVYDNLKIVSGAAGGGYYLVTTYDSDGNVILSEGNVSWEIGEEPTGYNYGS